MMDIDFQNKGIIDFDEAYSEMMNLISSKPKHHSIWFLEHTPVFTIGISEKTIHEDRSKQPPFIKTDRGGKTTYHGPGQWIFYFMLNLKSLPFPPSELTKNILKTVSGVLTDLDLGHQINNADPGIFISGKKVASIGMRIKKNYSYHGLSININTDLSTFNSIKPCGLDVEACNLEDYININQEEFKNSLIDNFVKLLTK